MDAVGLVQVAQVFVEPRRNNFSPGAGDDGSVSHFHVGLVREFDSNGNNPVARLVVHYTSDTPSYLRRYWVARNIRDVSVVGVPLLVCCRGSPRPSIFINVAHTTK